MPKQPVVRLFATLSILIISTQLLPTLPTPHAQLVGIVCMADSNETSCPGTAITLTGTAGSQLSVTINIQDSDSLNAFDIFVKADPHVLRPVSIDTAGTVLGSNILTLANCIEFAGSGCTALQNGPGVVRSAVVALSFATTAPTNGRLFSIRYDVVAEAPSFKAGFQTGCSNTSAGDFCVTVASGSTVVPETLLESTGTFGNFRITAIPVALTIRKGRFGLSTLTLTSEGGFFGGISLQPSVSPSRRGSPSVFFVSGPAVTLEPGTSTTDLIRIETFRNTPIGQYIVTVTATSGEIVHTVTVAVSVPAR